MFFRFFIAGGLHVFGGKSKCAQALPRCVNSPLRSAAPPRRILATITAPVASSFRIVAPWWNKTN